MSETYAMSGHLMFLSYTVSYYMNAQCLAYVYPVWIMVDMAAVNISTHDKREPHLLQ